MTPSIDQYIAELLYDYDCVVVPRLGGFVSNYRPARFDTRKGLAVPPGKDIRFNRNLTKNDGLLASACAESMGWSFEEGNEFVRTEVENYLNRLNDGAKIKLKKIGILYIDGHKNLRFEPDEAHNLLKQAWGFETFALPAPVKRAAPAPQAGEAAPVADQPETREAKVLDMPRPRPDTAEVPERESARSQHTRSIYRVAAATLLPFVALSVYMGVQTGFKSSGEFTPADLNPFSTGGFEGRTYTPSAAAEFRITTEPRPTERTFPDNDGVFAFSFSENRADTTGVWIDMRKIEETVANGIPTASFGTYHLISGCFSEAANAEKHVAQLTKQGYDAAVLDVHKNLHRVRLESFDDYSEALNRLSTVRENGSFPGAWLLKKPMNH